MIHLQMFGCKNPIYLGDERGAAKVAFLHWSRGYVIFGADGGFKDELWEYNPYTDSWNIKSNIPGWRKKKWNCF